MAATPSQGQPTAPTDLGPHQGAVGPVHINLPFRDPLFPEQRDFTGQEDVGATATVAAGPGGRPTGDVPPKTEGREPGWTIDWPVSLVEPVVHATEERRTVVVAGHGAGAIAEAFARAHRLPLLAEPSSNARFGPNAIGPYRMLLGRFGTQVERAVVLAGPHCLVRSPRCWRARTCKLRCTSQNRSPGSSRGGGANVSSPSLRTCPYSPVRARTAGCNCGDGRPAPPMLR